MRVDLSTLVLAAAAIVLAAIACVKDPGLPLIGARNGLARRTWSPVTSGARPGSGRWSSPRSRGMIAPGGPMVSVPFMVAAAHAGAGLPALVAYMTSWSLFGLQRIIAWEAPLMGRKFVITRVASTLAFPVLAGWLVAVFYQD
jgi:hypothetical protein